jgi:hypothetical protein
VGGRTTSSPTSSRQALFAHGRGAVRARASSRKRSIDGSEPSAPPLVSN